MTASRFRAFLAGLAIVAAPLLSAAAADAPKAADAERARIEAIVHDYLLNNPDVIIEAVQAFQDKQQADKEKAQKDQVAKLAPELLHDARSQILGNPDGDCAIVEFFDNQCPYCQANEPELQAFLKQDPRVKLVLKEFPILGPVSLVASKAALASVNQGKYVAFHEAMLAHKGHYEKESVVDDIAKSVGLDMNKLHKDMESPEIAAELDQNLSLGRSLDIDGTPGFVIGDKIVAGLSKVDELKQYVADSCPAKS